WTAEDLREDLPHLEGRAMDEDVVVRPERPAPIHVGWRAAGGAIAAPGNRFPARVVLAQVDPDEIQHGILLGDLDALSQAGGVALNDRGEDADGQMQAGAGVAETGFDLRGRAVGRAGDAHRAAHGLRDHLEALVAGVRSGAAESLYRGRDDP